MADKAILFDSSRCTGCKLCQLSCNAQRGAAPLFEDGAMVRGGTSPFACDDEGGALLTMEFEERWDEGDSVPFHAAWTRVSCMHCRDAACVRVCPTGAMAVQQETGLVLNDAERCVSCGLCQTVCPFDVPRPAAGEKRIVKCDGCAARLSEGEEPWCVAACPADALRFDDRDIVLDEVQQRVAALQERGWERACVFGATEQGGLGVIEVLKLGPDERRGEVLADTGANSTVRVVELVGPVSLGILGLVAITGVLTLGYGMKQPRR